MNSDNRIDAKYIIEPFMFDDAKEFYHSAKQLKRDGNQFNKPYFVLLSLSIELVLKSFGVRQKFVGDS